MDASSNACVVAVLPLVLPCIPFARNAFHDSIMLSSVIYIRCIRTVEQKKKNTKDLFSILYFKFAIIT